MAALDQADGQEQACCGEGDGQVAIGIGQLDEPAEGDVAEPGKTDVETAANERTPVAGCSMARIDEDKHRFEKRANQR